MSTVDSQFDPFDLSTPSNSSNGRSMDGNVMSPMSLSTETILSLMEKDEKLAKLASNFRASQPPANAVGSGVTLFNTMEMFSTVPAMGRSSSFPTTIPPTIASLGSPSPLSFPMAQNPFIGSPSGISPSSVSSSSPPGIVVGTVRMGTDTPSSSLSSSTDSSPYSSPSKSLFSDSSSPGKSYFSAASGSTPRKALKDNFGTPASIGPGPSSSTPKSLFGPPPYAFTSNGPNVIPNTDRMAKTDEIFSRGALPRTSRNLPIGKDYLDHANKEIVCGMANGLCIMTHPNVPYELSLSQFLPLVSEVTEALVADLVEASKVASVGKKDAQPVQVGMTLFEKSPMTRFGAVCRSERSRVHYYVHIYDPLVPVHKLFERLMLHPATSKLESVSRIYPVTASAHPDVDFAEMCIRLISSHPMTLKISNAAALSAIPIGTKFPSSQGSMANGGGIHGGNYGSASNGGNVAKQGSARSISGPSSSSSSSSSFPSIQPSTSPKSPTLTIGLALESHRASEFAKELSAAIISSLPFIEIVERNPMHCDLMLSSCYFNSVFMTTLWEPINTNDLNNYRPLEMLTWSLLHPHYHPRTPLASSSDDLEEDTPRSHHGVANSASFQKNRHSRSSGPHSSPFPSSASHFSSATTSATRSPSSVSPPNTTTPVSAKTPLLRTDCLINTSSLDQLSFKRSRTTSSPQFGYGSPSHEFNKAKNNNKKSRY